MSLILRCKGGVACILGTSVGLSEVTTGHVDRAQGMLIGHEAQGMPEGHKGCRGAEALLRNLCTYSSTDTRDR